MSIYVIIITGALQASLQSSYARAYKTCEQVASLELWQMIVSHSPTFLYSYRTIVIHFMCTYVYVVPGETPEQKLENALTTMNQRQAKYGGMTALQFQAVQEKRKQLWKKKVNCYYAHMYVVWSQISYNLSTM